MTYNRAQRWMFPSNRAYSTFAIFPGFLARDPLLFRNRDYDYSWRRYDKERALSSCYQQKLLFRRGLISRTRIDPSIPHADLRALGIRQLGLRQERKGIPLTRSRFICLGNYTLPRRYQKLDRTEKCRAFRRCNERRRDRQFRIRGYEKIVFSKYILYKSS